MQPLAFAENGGANGTENRRRAQGCLRAEPRETVYFA